MQEDAFAEVVAAIRRKDTRYEADAYTFVRAALDFTSKALEKPREGPERHVSGTELLDGFRKFALQEFGPMAATVLASWGVATTADIGEIVFNLVERGILGKTDRDRREDFAAGYDFREAFVEPFLPESTSRREREARQKPAHPRKRTAPGTPAGQS